MAAPVPAIITWRRALADSDLPAAAKHVGLTMSLYADGDGTNIRPGDRLLAADTSMHTATVGRARRRLEADGWLQCVRHGQTHRDGTREASEYATRIPQPVDKAGDERASSATGSTEQNERAHDARRARAPRAHTSPETSPETERERAPAEVVAIGPAWRPSPECTATLQAAGYSDRLIGEETQKFQAWVRRDGRRFADPFAAFELWVRRTDPDRLALGDARLTAAYERCGRCNYPLLADGSCDECVRRKRDSTPLTASARRAGAEAARRAREALADGTMGRLAEGGT